ncbi:MAG: glycosyltransferase family 2 protein [Shinella sp.]|nr:glycosyltransferase family 2 protein [Shinella sp.]
MLNAGNVTNLREEATPGDIELTILMPCLNEAETIATCIEKANRYLAEHGVHGEVLIADNGSSDGSQDIAHRHGARVVPVPTRGYGAALISGIRAARGRFVIMGDADDSYDFLNLQPFVDRLRQGDELVMGNRFRGGIKPGAMPFLHRYLGNPVLSGLGRFFFASPVRDFHCGLRGFSRDAVLKLGLVSPGMEFASEMVVKSVLNGLTISEAPTTLSPDGRSRKPHLRTWHDGWRHLRFLLLHSPRWLFFYPGLVLLLLGGMLEVALLFGPLRIGGIRLEINSMIGAGFGVLAGVQLISFSILARRYAAAEGFLPKIATFPRLMAALDLERVLQMSAVLLVAALGGAGWSAYQWANVGFGDIHETSVTRVFLVSLLCGACAIQIAASAFLASVFSIRHPRDNE